MRRLTISVVQRGKIYWRGVSDRNMKGYVDGLLPGLPN